MSKKAQSEAGSSAEYRRGLFIEAMRKARIGQGKSRPTAELIEEIAAHRRAAEQEAENDMSGEMTAPTPGSKAEQICNLWLQKQDAKWVAAQAGVTDSMVYATHRIWQERLDLPLSPAQKARRAKKEFYAPAQPAQPQDTDAVIKEILQAAADAREDAKPDVALERRLARDSERSRIKAIVHDMLLEMAINPPAPQFAPPDQATQALTLAAMGVLARLERAIGALPETEA